MSIGWIIFLVSTVLWHYGLFEMFKKAGIAPWKAFIPFYNTWCIVSIMEIKKWWFYLIALLAFCKHQCLPESHDPMPQQFSLH